MLGKSTMLARLLSDLSAQDFHQVVQTGATPPNLPEIARPGVKAATTTVPKLYNIPSSDLNIFDVPGLNDPEPTKKLIHNVLRMCLLGRVQVSPIKLHCGALLHPARAPTVRVRRCVRTCRRQSSS